jgi:hypothetical protein
VFGFPLEKGKIQQWTILASRKRFLARRHFTYGSTLMFIYNKSGTTTRMERMLERHYRAQCHRATGGVVAAARQINLRDVANDRRNLLTGRGLWQNMGDCQI